MKSKKAVSDSRIFLFSRLLHGKLQRPGFAKNTFKQRLYRLIGNSADQGFQDFAAATSRGAVLVKKDPWGTVVAFSLSALRREIFPQLLLQPFGRKDGNFNGRNAEPFGMQDFEKHFISIEWNFIFMGRCEIANQQEQLADQRIFEQVDISFTVDRYILQFEIS